MKNSIKTIIKSGALTELNPVIQELFERLPHAALVCDRNTYEAAGTRIEKDYKGTLDLIIMGIKDEILMPEEPSIGEIFLKVSDKTELLIACGSGVINDITLNFYIKLLVLSLYSLTNFLFRWSSLLWFFI